MIWITCEKSTNEILYLQHFADPTMDTYFYPVPIVSIRHLIFDSLDGNKKNLWYERVFT